MPIRTGKEYQASLQDGRSLYIDGQLIQDVTQYGPTQGVIQTIADLYDLQHDPAYTDILTYVSPKTGDRVSKTYLEARDEASFRDLAGCYHLRAKKTFGLMGRLTDFMSALMMDYTAALRAQGFSQAADRIRTIVDHCRENDLQVTHALIDPQTDRSRPDAPSQAVHIVDQRSDGIVVSGCRLLSTLAPVANECSVGPFYPRRPGEEKFAVAFQIPIGTPGLKMLARESYHKGEPKFDRPVSSRFDEGDAVLMFDRVFVPNERIIVAGEIDAYNAMNNGRPGYVDLQACTRSTMKLRFLAGLATAVARANGRDKTPRFQAAIGELMAYVAIAEGIRESTITEGARRSAALARGEMVIEGDGLTEPKVIGGYGWAAVNVLFPMTNTKAADVLRMAAGSGVLAVTEEDYNNPDVGRLMDEWLVGPNICAKDRLELMKLAWDMTGTTFGSRAALYERLYSGDPEINAQRWFKSPVTEECEELVRALLNMKS